MRGIEHAIENSSWMLRLGANWDGEGAARVHREAYAAAIACLRHVAVEHPEAVAPSISPCADGTVDLEWHRRTPFILLVNFGAGGVADLYGETTGGNVKVRNRKATPGDVADAYKQLQDAAVALGPPPPAGDP